MKSIKQIALTVLITIGAFSAITYTSCNKDACANVTCQNGGTCTSGTCVCSSGYEGTNCETISRVKYIKSWSASETVTGSTGSTKTLTYTAAIAANNTSTDITQVFIGNITGTAFFTNSVTAYVSATSVTIPTQQPDKDGYTIAGTGTYANGQINWTYTITDPTNAINSYVGTWN